MIFELDESGVLKPEAFAGAFGGVTCVGGAKGGLSGELILGGETMPLDKGLLLGAVGPDGISMRPCGIEEPGGPRLG